MKLYTYGNTDVGAARDHNEDSFLIDNEVGLCVIADGMGGHSAGEVASSMFTSIIESEMEKWKNYINTHPQNQENWRAQVLKALPQTIEIANLQIYEESQRDNTKRGMGTTGILFLPFDNCAFTCHVGDSRLYLYRSNRLYQLTEDHSLVMSLYKQGFLAAEDLPNHPQKNVILRSVGSKPNVEVDTLYFEIFHGDTLLLCTDGLTDMVSYPELVNLLETHRGLDLVNSAINLANKNGGKDNITVVIAEVHDDYTESSPTLPSLRFGITEKAKFLKNIYLFSELTEQECFKFNRIIYQQEYPEGTPIIRQGEYGEELFIIANGSVGIWKEQVYLTSIGAGGHFGEMGIIGNEQRSATVLAESDCTLFVIKREDLRELFNSDQTLANKVLWAFLSYLADRVRDLTNRLSSIN